MGVLGGSKLMKRNILLKGKAVKKISIVFDRDSVCMADDCCPHQTELKVDETMSLKDFIVCW